MDCKSSPVNSDQDREQDRDESNANTKRAIVKLGDSQYIGSLNVSAHLDWSQLDQAVLITLANFLQLGNQSAASEIIAYYEVGADGLRRVIADRRPLMLPFGYLIEDNCIRVSLINDW